MNKVFLHTYKDNVYSKFWKLTNNDYDGDNMPKICSILYSVFCNAVYLCLHPSKRR